MSRLKIQFFISYAVMGSLMPLLSVFFAKEKGLTRPEIGLIMGASGFSMIISPVIMTLLADLRIEAGKIIALALVVSSFFILGMQFTSGFWIVGMCYALYHLSYVAVPPLQDAMYFRSEAEHDPSTGPAVPYNAVRVWGTIGFIVPSAVLWGICSAEAGKSQFADGRHDVCRCWVFPALGRTQPALAAQSAAGKRRRW